jgi:hypothetical protein
MSEADRVFPRQEGQEAPASSTEKRLILSAPRRSGIGAGKSRVVEVVHVRRSKSRPVEDGSRPVVRNVHAETWPEGFRAKSTVPPLPPQDMQSPAPEPVQPTTHVMAMYEPSPQPPAEPVVTTAEPPVETAVVKRRKPRISESKTPQVRARRFAGPLAADEEGANCIRCGYLIQPAREKRGLMTCAACS